MIKRWLITLTALVLVLPRAVFASAAPNDPDFARQWYLPKIGVPEAWNYTQGSGSVIVAVLDTGVQLDHPDLKDNIWTNPGEIPGNGIDDDHDGLVDDVHGWNYVENNNDPSPQWTNGWTEAGITHGTVVSGIIAGETNNGIGVTGIAPGVKIMPLRVLDSQGIGDPANAAAAIDYAAAHGARVLNFSFVTDEHNIALDEAIARAAKAGVLIVAAAGNNSSTGGDNLAKTPMYPICSDGAGTNYVIGVAATDESDRRSAFSDYGTNCVDISAPGSSLYSDQIYDPALAQFRSYSRGGWSGTSVAAPVVSGVAALMLSANPGLSRETLVQYLLGTANPIDALNPQYRGELGVGRVNALRAVEASLGLPVAMNAAPPAANIYGRLPYVALGANAGGTPEVRVYKADGALVSKWNAYAPTFRGGVNVAAGDLTGDGAAEIVTGAGVTGGPQVRIFDLHGNLLGQFFAYDPRFRGGVSVAVGDVDGDGKGEIIAGAGPGGGPHIRVFDINGNVKGQFFAYAQSVATGVNVASGDIDGDARAEILVGPATAAGSQPIKYFTLAKNSSSGFILYGQITYLAAKAAGGAAFAVADVGNDYQGDIILGRTVGSGTVTVVFSGRSPADPFSVKGLKGMSLSSLDLSGYGRAVILAASSSAGKILAFDSAGKAVAGVNVPVPYASGASVAGFLSR